MNIDNIDIDRLHVSTVDVKPITIESWHPDYDGEYVEPEDGPQWWEAFEYTDFDDVERILVAHTGRVVALVHEGSLYQDWETYESDVVEPAMEQLGDDDDLPVEIVQSERDWNRLMEVEPTMYGSEGPMMNYWYPLAEQEREWSSFDPIDAAARLGVSSLTIVQIGDEYGLALAGGGMDFSWQICEAYIVLGYCPPVHFADLPRMAEEWTDRKELVLRGMKRSLTWLQENLRYRLERLDELKERR